MDTRLIKALKSMADQEKKVKEFKKRIRVKGKLIKKGLTKNGNIRLIIGAKNKTELKFIILKTHKEKYALAEKLMVGDLVSIEGINRYTMIICTKLKQINLIDEASQTKLNMFSE